MTTRSGPRGVQLSRRTALGGAISVGTGLGAIGLFVSQQRTAPQHASRRAAWQSPLHSEAARVAQLVRRATLGVRPEALEAALSQGYARTVDALVDATPAEPPRLVGADDPSHGATLGGADLQKWWLAHILSTPTPFAERMTYFWHGHFTSSLDKVDALFLYWQNLTWRRLALADLGRTLREVSTDPAMLTYLDLAGSDASDPSQPPNENYARELMELFTLGPGNYVEADVKSAAKALAGWTTPPPDAQVEVVVDQSTGARETTDVWYEQKPGFFDAQMAFQGEVKYLGRRGRLGLTGVVDQILAQPAATSFLSRKVAAQFIAPSPSEDTINAIAGRFRAAHHDVKALMRAALTSPEFVDPHSYRSLVKSPVEFMVGAAAALGAPVKESVELITNYGEAAGESLFQPPNVAGWPGNARWISPSTMLARFNFINELLDAVPSLPPAQGAERLYLDGVLGDSTAWRLAEAASDRERWLVILTSPEFNLK